MLRYVWLVNPSLSSAETSWVLAGETEWGSMTYIPDAWGAGQWGKHHLSLQRSNTIVKEFLNFLSGAWHWQGSMGQNIVWITILPQWKVRKIMDKGAMWYQHECGQLLLSWKHMIFRVGKKCTMPVLGSSPRWSCLVLLKGISITVLSSSRHSVIGLLWSLWRVQHLEVF